jgi:predicted transposase YdaD
MRKEGRRELSVFHCLHAEPPLTTTTVRISKVIDSADRRKKREEKGKEEGWTEGTGTSMMVFLRLEKETSTCERERERERER